MSDIGFENIFDSGSFDKGTKQIAKYIERITDEITKAEIAAEDFAKVIGKDLKNEINKLASSSKTLSKDMADMTKKMNAFKTTTTDTKKVISSYEKENEKLRKELEKLKKVQTGVTKDTKQGSDAFKGATKSMAGLIGGVATLHGGITTLKEQLVGAVKSTIEFEKVMKEVQAVSRASDSELVSLTKNANKLGATTEKLAVDVAGAQKELAKLGLTASEIIVSTEAIVDLSTATGEDLVNSATVATATLRAFGLEASEMGTVVDVMAGSFVRSGLDLDKFRESMKLVAPIARAVNVDIQTTTAMLSKLADAGLSGSLAGTALRNLMSSMADPTEDLAIRLGGAVKNSADLVGAFIKLKREGVDLAEAVQLVDIRARPAFFTLVNQAEAVEALAVQYKHLRDEASLLAKEKRDTLANDIDIATSAFDSLRRNMVEGYIPAAREATQTLTEFIEILRMANDGVILNDNAIVKATTSYLDYIKKVNPLAIAYKNLTTVGDSAIKMLKEMGVEMHNSTELAGIGRAREQFTSLAEVFEEVAKNTATLTNDYEVFTQSNAILAGGLEDTSEGTRQLREEFPELSEEIEDNREFLILLRDQVGDNIEKTRSFITALQEEKQGLKDLIESLEEQQKTQELGKIQTEQLTAAKDKLGDVDQAILDLGNLMKGMVTDLTVLYGKENKRLREQYELKTKLLALQGKNQIALAKYREEEAKNALDEEESLKMKLPLLEDYYEARENVLETSLKSELDIIKNSDDEKEVKDQKRQLAYTNHNIAKLKLDEAYKKEYEKILDGIDDANDALMKSEKDAKIASAQAAIDEVESMKKIQADIAKDMEGLRDEIGEEELEWAKEQYEKLKEYNEQKAEDEKELWETKLAYAEAGARGLSMITTRIFDGRQIARDNELKALEEWEEERIRMAGDNEEAKLRIREEAARKEAEIRKKQAQDNKKEAIFQIIIDTAMGIMKAVGANPILGIPLGAVIGALGAAQIATVIAQPLPQFAKGTDDSPEGFAEVGERGRELIRDGKTGKWSITPETSTVTYLTKHSQVITNAETERILSQDHNSRADEFLGKTIKQNRAPQIDYGKIGKAVGQELANIPSNITNFDENGVTKFVMGRSSKIKRLNKKY